MFFPKILNDMAAEPVGLWDCGNTVSGTNMLLLRIFFFLNSTLLQLQQKTEMDKWIYMIISILPHRLVPLYLDRGFLSILATSKMGMIG